MNIKLDSLNEFELALTIRAVEEKFLHLFKEASLNGTVHTCIGQELSAVAFCKNLYKTDYVFSNHRCHGHFIAFTKEYKNLISELMGKESGVCAGIGGSQHLSNKNFFSNGPQGSLAPVALGAAKASRILKKNNVVVCFIGDGTMGEGIIYEAMNMSSLYKVPIVFVCENNLYAQSTPIAKNLAGSIFKRAESFDLQVFEGDTWDYDDLSIKANKAISDARDGKPAFFLVNTYRLKAHSKGDDDRDKDEIKHYHSIDLLNKKINTDLELDSFYKKIRFEIESYVEEARTHEELSIDQYVEEKISYENEIFNWKSHTVDINDKQVNQINQYFYKAIEDNNKIIIIGEDIDDPYGGAFKVTKGLSTKYKDNIISTPISEAGIVGMGIGLSLLGFKPFVEIMFGDFISYSFDQILSNASKFFHMYNKQISVPIVIRTPMGGGRGYGPTHSQSIEKIFIGLNNIQIIVLNTLVDVKPIFKTLEKNQHTTILIENKIDYGRLNNKMPKNINYTFSKSNTDLPLIVGQPRDISPEFIIITYGGAVHVVLESIDEIFYEFEIAPKVIVITEIYPVNISMINSLISDTEIILTVEEGNIEGGFGSEIISSLIELSGNRGKTFKRVGSINIPIPSTKKLEEKILINSERIISTLRSLI